MTVDILIATVNKNLKNVPLVLLEEREDVSYIVSVQDIDGFGYEIPHALKNRRDVKVVFCIGKGLSLNRNNCLKYSTKDICVIADDDVSYKNEYIDIIKSKFIENTTLDVLVGKIKTYAGEPEYKKYKEKKHSINIFNFKNISSIEIAFRRASIIKNSLSFDTDFGLGSKKFPKGGEESIFIKDALDKKLNVLYFPFFIVEHPYESSGKIKEYNEKYYCFLGGYSRRVFGKLGVVFIIYFLIKLREGLTLSQNSLFIKKFIKGFNQ
ncbi:glycosyltransferase [Tenacibaculum sp. Ill]|uniref:glycosyltransferase n=1 Tax=Tenacibaculum sp. Ill TaxID=3445935 RepID=UPI003F7AEF4F